MSPCCNRSTIWWIDLSFMDSFITTPYVIIYLILQMGIIWKRRPCSFLQFKGVASEIEVCIRHLYFSAKQNMFNAFVFKYIKSNPLIWFNLSSFTVLFKPNQFAFGLISPSNEIHNCLWEKWNAAYFRKAKGNINFLLSKLHTFQNQSTSQSRLDWNNSIFNFLKNIFCDGKE